MVGIVHRTFGDRALAASARSSFVALGLLLSGCPFAVLDDERTLLEANGSSGSGGTSSGNAGTAAGGGGTAGAAGGSPFVPTTCIYVGGEPAPECATLVQNPGFGSDISDWVPGRSTILIGWDARDRMGSNESGAIGVNNIMNGKTPGLSVAGAEQCLPATGGGVYDFAVDVFIPENQEEGAAALSAYFYFTPECVDTNGSQGDFTTESFEEVGVWGRVGGTYTAPSGTVSMTVRLVSIKPFSTTSFRPLFDNVQVKLR